MIGLENLSAAYELEETMLAEETENRPSVRRTSSRNRYADRARHARRRTRCASLANGVHRRRSKRNQW